MSLRLRVVVAIAVLLFTASMVGMALAGWQANQVLREELTAALAGGRNSVVSTFEALAKSDHPDRDVGRLVAAFDGNRHLEAILIDARGRTLGKSRPLSAQRAPDWFAAMFRPDMGGLSLRVPAPIGGWFVLSPLAANDVSAIWAEFVDLIAVLSASFVIGSILVWLTVGQALRPLSDFAAAFLRIGSGDYSSMVREVGPPELARLGRGVNDMAGRLAAMQARTNRLEDQLRTLQDEERADLARDLHDEIGPHLFAVNVDAAMARRLIDEGHAEEASRQVEAIQGAVAHMQRLVRDILGRLRPTELIELGLRAAIDELVSFWSVRHPAITFSVDAPDDGTLAIDDDTRETLYRVIQEGLNNAVRHGRPSRIEIEVSRRGTSEVLARVADDGGASGKPEGVGYGLKGMRERVMASNGELTIDRGRATGWTVTARLPIFPADDGSDEVAA